MPCNVYINFTRPRIFPTSMMKTLAYTQNKRRALTAKESRTETLIRQPGCSCFSPPPPL